MARAALVGSGSGALAGTLAGVPYYLAYGARVRLDWVTVGLAFGAFALATGGLVGVGVSAGILAADRAATSADRSEGSEGSEARATEPSLARRRSALAAILGGVGGGAIAGAIPGALGAYYFGGQRAPFMGTAAVAALPFVGALAAAVFIADIDARARGQRPRFAALVGMALVAAVPIAVLVGVVVASVDDDTALALLSRAADALSSEGEGGGRAAVGVLFGAGLGAGLGAHVGITTALARRFGRWPSYAPGAEAGAPP